eukprot:TRINITY_DN16584_c0_g1_i1.p1 TRINITY_DN16584_c0_g1~~TRINITY_DN16584_c0_g1_i1.p1  ORF type:complete len:122 (+),score=20.76 TRINITY_DN16584_c0_g1_i1:379-744(+)
MDYCPFVPPASNADCPGNTAVGSEKTTDYYGSVAGVPSSRCFTATAFSQGYVSTTEVRATCYETVCLSSHELAIKLGDTFYSCPIGDTTTTPSPSCLLYTSDAADEEDSEDIWGRGDDEKR